MYIYIYSYMYTYPYGSSPGDYFSPGDGPWSVNFVPVQRSITHLKEIEQRKSKKLSKSPEIRLYDV